MLAENRSGGGGQEVSKRGWLHYCCWHRLLRYTKVDTGHRTTFACVSVYRHVPEVIPSVSWLVGWICWKVASQFHKLCTCKKVESNACVCVCAWNASIIACNCAGMRGFLTVCGWTVELCSAFRCRHVPTTSVASCFNYSFIDSIVFWKMKEVDIQTQPLL